MNRIGSHDRVRSSSSFDPPRSAAGRKSVFGPAVRDAGRAGTGHADHVENAGREAEQHEHDETPRRNPERAVEKPTQHRPDQDAGHQLGREPKAAGERRGIGGRSGSGIRSGWPARADMVEPFAETLEPRREIGIVGRSGPMFLVLARAVGHASTTRETKKSRAFPQSTPKPRGPY